MDNKEQTSPQRILILVTLGVVGGTQTSVMNLARTLHERGYDVTVASGEGEFIQNECTRHGIPYRRFDALKRTLNPFTMLSFLLTARTTIKRESFDVVHINSSNALFAAVAAWLSGVDPRVVFTFRGLSVLDESYGNTLTRFCYRLIFRFFMWFVDEPVFVSNANYDVAREKGLVTRGTVIHNGLDPERLTFLERESARAGLSRELGRDLTDAYIVGSVGRLAYQKNYEFLIDQIAELTPTYPELVCVIIGHGPEHDQLVQQIREKQLEQTVFLIGEREHASRYLRAFDTFVLPSRYEGLSITLIETLFAGVPVLASDVGGAREQFAHAPFQVYPLNDGEEFQKRLTRLVDNSQVREELAVANRDRSNDFTIERVADEYISLYTEAVVTDE